MKQKIKMNVLSYDAEPGLNHTFQKFLESKVFLDQSFTAISTGAQKYLKIKQWSSWGHRLLEMTLVETSLHMSKLFT